MTMALAKIGAGTGIGLIIGLVAPLLFQWNIAAATVLFAVSGFLGSFVWIVVEAYEDRMEAQRMRGETPSSLMETLFYVLVCVVGLVLLLLLLAAFVMFVIAKHR
jgi:hypothetical protein